MWSLCFEVDVEVWSLLSDIIIEPCITEGKRRLYTVVLNVTLPTALPLHKNSRVSVGRVRIQQSAYRILIAE